MDTNDHHFKTWIWLDMHVSYWLENLIVITKLKTVNIN